MSLDFEISGSSYLDWTFLGRQLVLIEKSGLYSQSFFPASHLLLLCIV